jgi:ACS family hexuronate transporter-like MFS transporter
MTYELPRDTAESVPAAWLHNHNDETSCGDPHLQPGWTIGTCGPSALFFATTVNYLDRQVLSLLAPELSKEFGWSNTDYANITAAFQFVYAISMLFAGRVVDRLGTKAAFALAIVVWSLGAIMHAGAYRPRQRRQQLLATLGIAAVPVSVIGFMLARAMLALGEAGNFPAAIKATAEYFPKKDRSFATGIFNSGANVGAVLAPISVPFIAALGLAVGLRVIGAIGFVWLGCGPCSTKTGRAKAPGRRRTGLHHPRRRAAGCRRQPAGRGQPGGTARLPPDLGLRLRQIHDRRRLVVLPVLAAEIPVRAIRHGRHRHPVPLAILYSMTMIGSIGGGWFPTYFINKGATPYDGRMKAMLLIACARWWCCWPSRSATSASGCR